MKINVCGTYLSPAKQLQFHRTVEAVERSIEAKNKKSPVARPATKKKTQPKLITFKDELKSLFSAEGVPCALCGSTQDIQVTKGKPICVECEQGITMIRKASEATRSR